MSKILVDRAVLEQVLEFWNEGKGLALGELLQKALEQSPRQPLTDEEIRDLFQNQKALPRLKKFIRVIEKAHGIGA